MPRHPAKTLVISTEVERSLFYNAKRFLHAFVPHLVEMTNAMKSKYLDAIFTST